MIALLIVPMSRLLVVGHVEMACGMKNVPFWTQLTNVDARARKYAHLHPEDDALQLATAFSPPLDQEFIDPNSLNTAALQRRRWNSVEALAARYPNSAVIAAASLRAAIPCVIVLQTEGKLSPQKTTPEDAAQYDRQAASGERIDPDNAYFPLMRAVGLYASGWHAEAAEAVLRAGAKSRWNEYTTEETEGRWHLAEARFGQIDALGRASISASILFPHYAALREVSRRIKAQAVQDERAGQIQQGIALRRAIMRCGGLMRAQSTSVIGSLVGIAIVKEGTDQPGGTLEQTRPAATTREQRSRLHLEDYCAFLTRNGQSGEARWARAESLADTQTNTIIQQTLESPRAIWSVLMKRLLPLLMAGMLVLMNTLWVIVIGMIASGALWVRARRLRAGGASERALPRGAVAVAGVLALGGFLAGPLLADSALRSGIYSDIIFPASLTALLVSVAVLLVIAMRLRMSLREGIWAVLAGAAMAAGGVVALLFVSQQTLLATQTLGLGGDLSTGATLNLKYGALILAAPFALFCLLSGAVMVRRVPYLLGLARGFAAACVPVTALLVIGYAAVVLVTVRQENQITQALTFQVQDEGEYLASLIGAQWPGIVPDPVPLDAKKA